MTQPEPVQTLLEQAGDPGATPFDYIVIGSGAGGGPLAARLALSGRRVLVIESGVDPLQDNDLSEVYSVPAYNGAATEDPLTSWAFSVRHYDDDARQRRDSKYDPEEDPSRSGRTGKGGIFYPRAAALGGCTSHHAMIVIRPNDADWDELATFTGDDSWRSEAMQGYFPKLERCLYYDVYKGYLGRILGGILWLIQSIATWINPRQHLDPNGHGFKGWQPTSFIDPLVIAGIVRGDATFLKLLVNVVWASLTDKNQRSILRRALGRLQIVQFLDPNVRANYADYLEDRARLSLISIGTNGKQRFGLREWLLTVRETYPDRLVLLTGAHVTRLIFTKDEGASTPRAIGAEVVHGKHLYRASPKSSAAVPEHTAQYFACREVIVSGGAFNSPQLLMLSGIGNADHLRELGVQGPRDRAGVEIVPPVDLPGVGLNLQDRYEVSVISDLRAEFSTLQSVSFIPGDEKDAARRQWMTDKTGLYGLNGGALAMMMSSTRNKGRVYPDHFVFGVPAAFRGYYRHWSRELLRKTKGAAEQERDLWTWVILKAYTSNNGGRLTLRTADPFDVPEINFHSFAESPDQGLADLDAIDEVIGRVRAINRRIGGINTEIQPGLDKEPGSDALRQWIQDEAWGHHACGTCRIGTDRWQYDVKRLTDRGGVVDSSFRVHGVRGLRVVDASVFPRIPGYFIVTPVFMVAEKAADVILADSPVYPSEVEHFEAAAIYSRREMAGERRNPDTPAETTLPKDCIGLALSGGGIRSATYSLGVLQALAATGILRRVDFMSTVSGGGYAGAFLGRLFTRMRSDVVDKVERVEAILRNASSPEIWWLRRHADYLAGAGRSDLQTTLAVLVRNLVSVLFCLSLLLFGVLGGLRLIADLSLPTVPAHWTVLGVRLSPWWLVPAAVLALAVLPLTIGYWLTPSDRGRSQYAPLGVLAWSALVAAAISATGIAGIELWGATGLTVLLLAWVWQEAVRWGVPPNPTADSDAARGVSPEDLRSRQDRAAGFMALYRNRLARALGSALFLLVATTGYVAIDSIARAATDISIAPAMGGLLLVVTPLLPFARRIATTFMPDRADPASQLRGAMAGRILLNLLAFLLAAGLFFAVDALAHEIFDSGRGIGVWAVAAALGCSVAFGRALDFVNLSSLQQQLTQKLTRTFLGAANDRRVHPTGTTPPIAIQVSDEGDDQLFGNYRPDKHGGPLHLISVCINQTVDHISGRQLRQNKGLPMCVGPMGVSVGRQYHAVWEKSTDLPQRKARVRALPVSPDPHKFHVFGRSDRDTATIEQLSLGRWIAISAASLATGSGRNSSLATSILLGLFNFRLGYWWDSGIPGSKRPSRYPPSLWSRVKSLPATIFAMQGVLFNEWRGHFEGPSTRRWYLSDGGHFDNTGLYELIRRRLPFIIAVDSTQDESYRFDDVAILMRQIRLDFDADVVWLDGEPGRTGTDPWDGFGVAAASIPAWIKKLIVHPERLGGLDQIRRDGPAAAALARIRYNDEPGKLSWLLLIKANLAPTVPADVTNYSAANSRFPNESTVDQFFGDDQWESYRSLGECAARSIFDRWPDAGTGFADGTDKPVKV